MFVRHIEFQSKRIYVASCPCMHTTDTLHEMRRLLQSGTGARTALSSLTTTVDAYTGTYQENKRNGKGTMKYANGDVYDGLWLEDEKNGSGTMKYANGDVYVGNWKDDNIQGLGIFTFKYVNDNEYDWKFSGEFKAGLPLSGTLTYKDIDNTYTQNYANKWTTDNIVTKPTTTTIIDTKKNVDPKSNNLQDSNTKPVYRDEAWEEIRKKNQMYGLKHAPY